MEFKFTRDVNGNKKIKITNNGKSFSIQTNGNLPFIHSLSKNELTRVSRDDLMKELEPHVYRYCGNRSQKIFFNK